MSIDKYFIKENLSNLLLDDSSDNNFIQTDFQSDVKFIKSDIHTENIEVIE